MTPTLATRAVLAKDGLTVDGQPFPYYIAEAVSVDFIPGEPARLHLVILVDGPVVGSALARD